MRTISLGEIILTKLRGYHWEIRPVLAPDGKKHAVITEIYTVTDEGYTVAPEKQKNLPVPLTSGQQTALDKLFKEYLLKAAGREQVDPDVQL